MISRGKYMSELSYKIGWSGLDRDQLYIVLGCSRQDIVDIYTGRLEERVALGYLEILTNYLRLAHILESE